MSLCMRSIVSSLGGSKKFSAVRFYGSSVAVWYLSCAASKLLFETRTFTLIPREQREAVSASVPDESIS